MVKIVYRIYQVLIALPILLVATIITALLTILCFARPNARWINRVQAFWARLFCYILFIPVHVTGIEHIKPGQSYVFVSNHQSMYDIFAIYGWLPVIFKWLMKYELKKVPFVGWGCQAAGHIFIKRTNAIDAQQSLRDVEKALTNGISTVIFPEGTRTANGEVGRFKRGAFQIALDVHLPIIPISLTGCYEVMNRRTFWVTRHPIHMHIGEPIDLQQWEGQSSAEIIEKVRDIVINNMD